MRATVLIVVLALAAWGPCLAMAQTPVSAPGCGQEATPSASATNATPGPAGESRRLALDNGEALFWPGDDRGVLLLHGAAYDAASWEPQAAVLSAQGYTVLAPESLSTDAILNAIAFLTNDCGVAGVTVIGASAGGGAALDALAGNPAGISGLILLGATGEVETLGEYPKLFTASEDEGLADRLSAMAESAPGDRNETLILPGSAHAQATFETDQSDALMEAILAFLAETDS